MLQATAAARRRAITLHMRLADAALLADAFRLGLAYTCRDIAQRCLLGKTGDTCRCGRRVLLILCNRRYKDKAI